MTTTNRRIILDTQTQVHAREFTPAHTHVLTTPEEGAYFAWHSDWGDQRAYPGAVPNKGAFFGLRSDLGQGYQDMSDLDAPDDGAFFGLHSDWGDGRTAPSTPPNQGAFFGLHSD